MRLSLIDKKGGLGVEPKCIAGIYSSTHIALDATQDVVIITTYLFFLSGKVALVIVCLAFN